ncbi:MAG: DNA methyltransferase [Nostoc sp. DedVER02]|uniref:DNA methyltransferase n=1 Tax=Nostoc sp. DedVER02 TaxID=3075405 RepID=UPI00391BEF26
MPFKEFYSCTSKSLNSSSTFINNMKLPVHRWFRFSAGFSAQWVETIISQAKERGETTVLDPFSGSGTTLLASEKLGVECLGIENIYLKC